MIKFENEKNGRFYYIDVDRDLFDELVIVVTRGGRFSSINKLIHCVDDVHCQAEINRLTRLRLQRGYTVVS